MPTEAQTKLALRGERPWFDHLIDCKDRMWPVCLTLTSSDAVSFRHWLWMVAATGLTSLITVSSIGRLITKRALISKHYYPLIVPIRSDVCISQSLAGSVRNRQYFCWPSYGPYLNAQASASPVNIEIRKHRTWVPLSLKLIGDRYSSSHPGVIGGPEVFVSTLNCEGHSRQKIFLMWILCLVHLFFPKMTSWSIRFQKAVSQYLHILLLSHHIRYRPPHYGEKLRWCP